MATRDIIAKADIAVSNLISNGGFDTQQTDTFIRGLIDMPTLLNEIRVVPMPSPQFTINKMGIGTRALHGAPASGTALADAKRTATTTSKITLNSKELMCEVHIPYDVLEDNVEKAGIGGTIMALVRDKVSIDLEELVVNGDTTTLPATDDLLCMCDGVLKRATSHVLDHTGTPVAVSLDPFKDMLKAMPNKYLRNRSAMRYYVSPHAEIDYATWLATRTTPLGDTRILGDYSGNPALGSMVKPCANMANAKAIFTDPKNIILGIQRNISVETDKDIRTRVLIFVLTMRVDVQIEETDAIVKYLGLNVT